MKNKLNLFVLALLVIATAACAPGQKAQLRPRVSASEAVPVDADGSIEVLKGDTVYAVSRRYKVPISAIVSENNLPRPYVLQAGTRLKIPAMAEYTVQPGDTADTIAMSRGISKQELMATNSTASVTSVQSMELAPLAPMELKPGDVVRVPEKAMPQAVPSDPNALASIDAPPGTVPPDNSISLATKGVDRVGETQYTLTPLGPSTTPTPVAPPAGTAAAVAPATPGIFDWPLEGRVLKNFGRQANGENNDGINIAAPRGTPVTAAAGGTVIHSGSVAALGNLVLVRHENNLITAYGHLDRVLVDRDSIVAQGDVLGTVGETGGVKTPQLHFQVRQGETPVDPQAYLPQR